MTVLPALTLTIPLEADLPETLQQAASAFTQQAAFTRCRECGWPEQPRVNVKCWRQDASLPCRRVGANA
jgi:hypothetical protein